MPASQELVSEKELNLNCAIPRLDVIGDVTMVMRHHDMVCIAQQHLTLTHHLSLQALISPLAPLSVWRQ